MYVVSLTQAHFPLSPTYSATSGDSLSPHTANSNPPAPSLWGPLSCSHCPQGLLLCPGPLRVPFQPLLSYLPAPGTLCPSKRAARTGCPPADKRWLGVSHFPFIVTEPAGRWVPRTGYFCGRLYFCSFSNNPPPPPPFTWLS